MEIRHFTVDDFFGHQGLSALLAEYAAESSIAGMPSPKPNVDIYRRLEASGAALCLGAVEGDELVGFLTLLVSLNPHYSAVIGVAESLFVAGAHRKSGAGLRLLREAEAVSKACGAVGFLVSAPYGGRLAEVLEASRSYRETNRIFFKALA